MDEEKTTIVAPAYNGAQTLRWVRPTYQIGGAASVRGGLKVGRSAKAPCERMGICIGRVIEAPVIAASGLARGSSLLPGRGSRRTTDKELPTAGALIPEWT